MAAIHVQVAWLFVAYRRAGGLAGADAHCQALAQSVIAGNRTWRAYLSTQGAGAVNARDRIGTRPWFNAKGQLVAQNVADLHGDNVRDRNQVNKDGALNEKGEIVNGRGDQPNRHDLEPSAQFRGCSQENLVSTGGDGLFYCFAIN